MPARVADEDGVTLDAQISRLARAERQRRMGVALARVELTDEERAGVDLAGEEVREMRAGDVVEVDFGVPAGASQASSCRRSS